MVSHAQPKRRYPPLRARRPSHKTMVAPSLVALLLDRQLEVCKRYAVFLNHKITCRDFCPTIKKGATPGTCRVSTSLQKPSMPVGRLRALRSQQYCCGFREHSIQAQTQGLDSTARTCADHREVQSDNPPCV